jgi:hypothetical protein
MPSMRSMLLSLPGLRLQRLLRDSVVGFRPGHLTGCLPLMPMLRTLRTTANPCSTRAAEATGASGADRAGCRLVLLIVTVPYAVARADRAQVVAPLPMSTAQTAPPCYRMCQKGKPCATAASVPNGNVVHLALIQLSCRPER